MELLLKDQLQEIVGLVQQLQQLEVQGLVQQVLLEVIQVVDLQVVHIVVLIVALIVEAILVLVGDQIERDQIEGFCRVVLAFIVKLQVD